MPAAVRVPPAGALRGAHSSTLRTALPKVRRAIGATAAAAMAVSVSRGAPAARAATPASQAPAEQRRSWVRLRSPLLWISRSSTSCSRGVKGCSREGAKAWRIKRMLSLKIGWSKPAESSGTAREDAQGICADSGQP